jgi:hypothetical protein
VVDHEIDAAAFQLSVLEVHDAVAHHYSFEVNGFAQSVVLVDFECEVGDVLAGVGLPGYPECVVGIFGEACKEAEQSVEVIVGGGFVVVCEVGVEVDGVAYPCWRLNEQQMGEFVP